MFLGSLQHLENLGDGGGGKQDTVQMLPPSAVRYIMTTSLGEN